MNTKQMEYIIELAQTKNFNKAAENLFISQPTLTYQIKNAEDEIGFLIFDRSSKGVSLTPAGEQFIISLINIVNDYKRAVDHGVNFSSKFQEDIRIAMPLRTSLFYLPDAIRKFMKEEPGISITPTFDLHHSKDSFLLGEQDILFSLELNMNHVPDVKKHHLFDSRIYLVCRNDDVLAKKKIIVTEDLKNRTLMVGGPSSAPLRRVQQHVVNTVHCDYFISHDHDTSLTNVAAGRALVLSPGYLNDYTNAFTWIPFDCVEVIPCALYTHLNDHRESTKKFLNTLLSVYKDKSIV